MYLCSIIINKNISIMKTISTNQAILNQLVTIANQVFAENEELFKQYGVAFTLQNVIEAIETINKHSYNKRYKDKTEIVINEGSFRCLFLRQDVFKMLQKFSGLPKCKVDKDFMFIVSENDSRIEKIKTYELDKKGNLKQKTVLVEFISDTFAFQSGKGDYAKMYYIVDGIGYYQGENSKVAAEQRAKQAGNNHDFAISRIKHIIEQNEYFNKILYLLATNLGFDPSELDANNQKFNETKDEKTRLYNERKEEEKRIEAEKQERYNQELIEQKQKELAQMKRAFLNGEYISVDNFRGLCYEFNIDIAPKTIGMLNKKIADISTQTVRYYANCKRKPNLENLYLIIETLKDLLLEQEQMTEKPELYITDSEFQALLNGTLSETFAPETNTPDQSETYYPVVLPSYCTMPDVIEHADTNITESYNIAIDQTIHPVIIEPSTKETKKVEDGQIQIQQIQKNKTDWTNITIPSWLKYVACFIAGILSMHFIGNMQHTGQTLNAATINEPRIIINEPHTVHIIEPGYTVEPIYIIDVETIELIKADIIELIEPDIISTDSTNDSMINHDKELQDTTNEYRPEIITLINTPQINIPIPDMSEVLSKKIPIPHKAITV